MKLLRTVLITGNFNVLHPGHLRLFRFAKEYGDKLIVAVLSDNLSGIGAYVPENLRLEGVQSNSWVDESFIIDEPITDVILRIRPDFVVKGKEHEKIFNPESEVLAQYGGTLVFGSGETVFSSLELIRKEFLEFDSKSISLPEEYLRRHVIKRDDLIFVINKFPKLRICVVGDLIIDEYITCQPLGMSQEDPTVVVMPLDSTLFLGGAGIVAAHATGLGASVDFISVTGSDSTREFAVKKLEESKVKTHLLIDDSRPTSLKQRYRSKGKSLLRVSHLHQGAISLAQQDKIFKVIEKVMHRTDLLVFSDFNYGCLPQPLVQRITHIAKRHNVYLAADSQSSSQVGDISRFIGMDLLTPTEWEARISTRNREDGLVVLAESLRQQSSAKNILLKLGEEGLLIHSSTANTNEWMTDRVDALNSSPKDAAGAGDSLLITTAMALASGANIWEAACLGSLAAAVQVGRVGNTPIKSNELIRELT